MARLWWPFRRRRDTPDEGHEVNVCAPEVEDEAREQELREQRERMQRLADELSLIRRDEGPPR